jgi:hypothetical protein
MSVVVDGLDSWIPACPAGTALIILLRCRAGIGTDRPGTAADRRRRRPVRRGCAVDHGRTDPDHQIAGHRAATAEIVADHAVLASRSVTAEADNNLDRPCTDEVLCNAGTGRPNSPTAKQ